MGLVSTSGGSDPPVPHCASISSPRTHLASDKPRALQTTGGGNGRASADHWFCLLFDKVGAGELIDTQGGTCGSEPTDVDTSCVTMLLQRPRCVVWCSNK